MENGRNAREQEIATMRGWRFTQSPWSIFRTPSGYNHIRGRNNERIASDIDGLDCSDAENIANIHLMVASPELLIVLENLVDYCTDYLALDDEVEAIIKDARSAIAKAKGEQK